MNPKLIILGVCLLMILFRHEVAHSFAETQRELKSRSLLSDPKLSEFLVIVVALGAIGHSAAGLIQSLDRWSATLIIALSAGALVAAFIPEMRLHRKSQPGLSQATRNIALLQEFSATSTRAKLLVLLAMGGALSVIGLLSRKTNVPIAEKFSPQATSPK